PSTATADISTVSLHDALPIYLLCEKDAAVELPIEQLVKKTSVPNLCLLPSGPGPDGIFNYLYSPRMLRLFSRFREDRRSMRGERSEEHTSELESRGQLVCRLP